MRSRLSLDILYNLKEILHFHRYKNRRSWWARMLFGGLQYWSLLLLVFGRSFLSGIFSCRLGLPLQSTFVDRAFLFGTCCPHSLFPFQSQFVSRSVPPDIHCSLVIRMTQLLNRDVCLSSSDSRSSFLVRAKFVGCSFLMCISLPSSFVWLLLLFWWFPFLIAPSSLGDFYGSFLPL